jgi:hypothetical protein
VAAAPGFSSPCDFNCLEHSRNSSKLLKDEKKPAREPSNLYADLFFCGIHISTGDLDTSGMIHKFRWLAISRNFQLKKAGPFLTLPFIIFLRY